MPAVTRRIPLAAALTAALAVACLPAPAAASDLLDRNATGIQLAVDRSGRALVTYRAAGRQRRVLVWGAINARHPDPNLPQVRFRIDYSGGWKTYRKHVWRGFRDACRPYDGPTLAWVVRACKAADGSYWALQSWQRRLPLLGFDPWRAEQLAWELRIAHWTGPLAALEVWTRWSYGGTQESLFGRLSYLGRPVHGFRNRPSGEPIDGYGRNLYVDTHESVYGPGWRREAGILAHRPGGTFCHSFVPSRPFAGYPSPAVRPAGSGDAYRVTVIGPGVTPDVSWEGPGLGRFSSAYQARMTRVFDDVMANDGVCRRER